MRHTPGPLVARRINNEPKPFAVINPNGYFGDEIVVGYLNEGDAVLFAAAPEMLDALEAVAHDLSYDEGNDLSKTTLEQVRTAIAKVNRGDTNEPDATN